MRFSRLVLAAGAFALGGCATLNESECRSVDWYQLGTRDGAEGYGRARLESHREACSEFGLAADDAAWSQGYEDGLQSYCTADNGYRVGRRGGSYAQVCPLETEREFLSAYELGRDTYEVDQELADVKRRIDSLESSLASDKTDDAMRRDLRRQVSEQYRQASWLRRSLDRLESEWRRRY